VPYQFRERGEFLEVRLDGVLESFAPFVRDLIDRTGTKQVLLNLEGVTSVAADTYALASQVQAAVTEGYRLAFFAPRPALFGISRQTLLLGNVEEGTAAGVFRDIEEARRWLLSA